MEHHISGVGFGLSGKPDFWIREGIPAATVHLAFAADDPEGTILCHGGGGAGGRGGASVADTDARNGASCPGPPIGFCR